MDLVLVMVLGTVLVRRLLRDHDDVVEEVDVPFLGLYAVVFSEVEQTLSNELTVYIESKRKFRKE